MFVRNSCGVADVQCKQKNKKVLIYNVQVAAVGEKGHLCVGGFLGDSLLASGMTKHFLLALS